MGVLFSMCDLCRQNPCHTLCPNYCAKKAAYCCSYCGMGIYEGEEYIVNDGGEYRHSDCFYGIRELLGWLGHEVMTMEEGC